MSPPARPAKSVLAHAPTGLARAAAVIGLLVGTLVLGGWAWDLPALTHMYPGMATMKPNTAVGFVVSGVVLLLVEQRRARLIQRVGAAAVVFLGLVTLGQDIFGFNLGIDHFLFGGSLEVRMSPLTAIGFMLLGSSLFLVDVRASRGPALFQAPALGALLLAFVALLGYAYNVERLYRVASYPSMALQTAFALLALSLGVLLARPDQGAMAMVTGPSLGGLVIRRQLPGFVVALCLLGWLRLEGQRAGLYDTEFGLALMVTLSTMIFSILVFHTGRVLHGLDLRRLAAEAAEREQRELLDTTLTSIGDAVIATDTGRHITFLNRAAEALTGWSVPAAVGRDLDDVYRVVDETTRRRIPCSVQKVLAVGTVTDRTDHSVLIARDGTERPIDESVATIRNAAGATFGAVLVFRDVGEKGRAEKDLRTSEERLRTVTDAARVGLVVVDPSHRYLFVNRAYCEIFGLPEGDLVGRRVADVLASVYEQQIRPRLDRGFAGERVTYELVVPRSAGGSRHCAVAYEPQSDGSGVRQVVSVVVDITDRKRAEEALKASEAALRDTDRRKDEFLATLAHELRNPLAPLRTGLGVLKITPAGERATRVREMMERQLTHMVRLIDDLLDVSRISRGTIELKKARVTVKAIMDSALEATSPLIESSGHTLAVWIPDTPLYLDVDPTRIAQALINLLGNAAKYTPRAGSIELSAERDAHEAVVRVKDTGIGLAEEMLPRVFEMFTQIQRTGEGAQTGLGIGLALARRLVEMHGGTVTAESAGPGQGSTFTVRLPLAVAPAGVTPAMEQASATAPTPGRRRILVVDDNVDAAETLAMVLESSEHEIRTAHAGGEALSTARIFDPDFVFLDIGLPDMDGYAVARQIRADPRLRRAVLIALTGWGSEDDRRRSAEAGFDVHLTKPVEITLLEGVLSRSSQERGHD